MAAATPPPMPPAAIMVIIIMNGKTSAKPASASVPSRPKMKVSAMATKVCADHDRRGRARPAAQAAIRSAR